MQPYGNELASATTHYRILIHATLYLVAFVLSVNSMTTYNVTVGGLGGVNKTEPIIAFNPSFLVCRSSN